MVDGKETPYLLARAKTRAVCGEGPECRDWGQPVCEKDVQAEFESTASYRNVKLFLILLHGCTCRCNVEHNTTASQPNSILKELTGLNL